jgi:hypothetical protein
MFEDVQRRLDDALLRIQNINFFPHIRLSDTQSLIDQIEKILSTSDKSLFSLDNPWEVPKAVMYRKGIYGIVRRAVHEANEMVEKKLYPIVENIMKEASEDGLGGVPAIR